MENMARVLLECETIYAEEVDMLMNGASPDEVKRALADRLSYKQAHREDMEKAPIKKLSDIDPINPEPRLYIDVAEAKTPDAGDKAAADDKTEDAPHVENAPKAEAPKKKPIKRATKKSDDETENKDDKTE